MFAVAMAMRQAGVQCRKLVVAQACGQRRLQQGISAGRPAAQVGIGDRKHVESGGSQQALHHTANLLAML